MRAISFFPCLMLLLWGLMACGVPQKKAKPPDRRLLGDELQFGRDAARFDLWNEAIFRWKKVVLAEPDHVEAVNNLAVAYESVGDYEKAKTLYQNALELDEDSKVIRKNYKRFLNFYKRHQRQIQREKDRKQKDQSEGQENQEGGEPEGQGGKE